MLRVAKRNARTVGLDVRFSRGSLESPRLRRALEEQGFTKVHAFEAMKPRAKEAKRHADRLTILASRT
jgi:hypothetical protein